MKNPYKIQFEGLSLGIHPFDFTVDKAIFDDSNIHDVMDVDIEVDVVLTKTENMMDLQMVFKGALQLPCDRCYDRLNFPLEEETRLVVKYGQSTQENLDELMVLDDHVHEIDLTNYFYETINLFIPQRHVHEESECDPEVLKMLSNRMEVAEEEKIDPRWEKLKKL